MSQCMYVYGASDDLVEVRSTHGGPAEEFQAYAPTTIALGGTELRFSYGESETWTAEILATQFDHEVSIVKAVGEDAEHTDERAPEFAPGYSDVVIVTVPLFEDPVEIIDAGIVDDDEEDAF